MNKVVCYCNEQLGRVTKDLNVVRLELTRIQECLNRLLMISQNPTGYFYRRKEDSKTMKVLFLMAGSTLRQTKSVDNAACIKFMSKQSCRLFEFDLSAISIKELKIPDIQTTFGEKKEDGDKN